MGLFSSKPAEFAPAETGPTPQELAAQADEEQRNRKRRKGLLGTILTGGDGVADTLG